MKQSPLIIPLDGMKVASALTLAKQLSGSVWGFKVNDLLIECGVDIVTQLKRFGNVFADPKLHDIPNTVANGVRRLADAGADLITVHASGGEAMMEAACTAAGASKILAVTVLTSLRVDEAWYIYGQRPAAMVRQFALQAQHAGVHGIVCSPQELHTKLPKGLVKVVPGIRPAWYARDDDQSRTATPAAAIKAGADLLVIGRPITRADDPRRAVAQTHEEIAGA